MQEGMQNRTIRASMMNLASARGHNIYQIKVKSRRMVDG
jgi:hypothetical protein